MQVLKNVASYLRIICFSFLIIVLIKILLHRYAEMIEKSLNFVFLSEMVGCTIIICFLEYGVLKVFQINICYIAS